MQESQSLASVLQYYRQVLKEFSKGIRASFRRLQMLIGILITLAILLVQIRFGLVPQALVWPQFLSFSLPYLVLILVVAFFHVVRAPWKVDKNRREEIAAIESAYQQLTKEQAELSATLTKQAMRPEIKCEVEEIHLYPKPKGVADLFVRLRLEDLSNRIATIESYTAELQIKGKLRPGYFQDDLHLYVMTRNKRSTDEYGVDEWFPIPMATESLSDLSHYRDIGQGYPVSGWLHFIFPDLPYWPKVEVGMPIGGEEEVVDHETGETAWVEHYNTELSIKPAEAIMLRINDIHRTNPQIEIRDFDHDPSRIIRKLEPSP